jgi:hypothetical protein
MERWLTLCGFSARSWVRRTGSREAISAQMCGQKSEPNLTVCLS